MAGEGPRATHGAERPWKVIFPSDSEPAVLDLKRAGGAALKSEHGVDVVMEEIVVGDSSGNGAAELAAREVKAKVRAVRSEVDRLHGVEIKSDSPALTWLVEHAANTINIGRR